MRDIRRQDKDNRKTEHTRQAKSRRGVDKKRQDNARQCKVRQNKARQGTTRQRQDLSHIIDQNPPLFNVVNCL